MQETYSPPPSYPPNTRPAPGMTPEQQYIYDLAGYVVIPNVLSEAEVGALNAAIDRHAHLITRSESYAHGAPKLRGENNLIVRLAKRLLDLRGAAPDDEDSFLDTSALLTDAHAAATASVDVTMGSLRRELGSCAKLALTSAELGALMDVAALSLREPSQQPAGATGDDLVLRVNTTRGDLGGMLEWENGDAEPFRSLLCHPNIKPTLETVLGTNYRMDHMPDLMTSESGDDGHSLHGGNYEAFGRGGTLYSYSFSAGRMHSGMLVVEYILADEGPGDGGVCVVPGSHKTNYPVPSSLCRREAWLDFVTEVHAKKGDCVVFGEACTHGALPWRGAHQRRALLYRYSPGHAAYTPGLGKITYPEWIQKMQPEQAQVLLNPGFPSGMREERVLKPTVEAFLGLREGAGANGEFPKL